MKTLDGMLAELGALRRNLLLEISETNEIEDLVAAGKLLARFRRAGNPICLDDFGSGVSSFPYLQALPIDFVKVDGSYIQTMLSDDRHAAIIKAMAALCHDLDVRTVAEMIETEGQARRLRELGIDFGQGWLFGRPLVSLPTAATADIAEHGQFP